MVGHYTEQAAKYFRISCKLNGCSPPPRLGWGGKYTAVATGYYFLKNRAENFFLKIDQYGYLKTQNFTLIPNPKAKKKTQPKNYSQKTVLLLVFSR